MLRNRLIPRESTGLILRTCVVLLLAGCQAVVTPTPTPSPSPSPTPDPEPDGSFSTARIVSLAVDDSAVLSGTIDGAGDVDVFNLGAVSAGDEVRVTLRRLTPGLHAALALYDDEGELIAEDTLTSVDDPTADPELIHVVRADSVIAFAAVSHTFIRTSTGDYEITVNITRGGVTPAPKSQLVLLNFDGGQVNDPLLGHISVGPFDAGDISALYEGQTATFRSIIVQTVNENYAGLDISFVDDAADLPSGSAYSEIVFGGFSVLAFGAAEAVDSYNGDPTDRAIIFTGSFEPDLFPFDPTAEELAIAIGNVASHELGHLLGLNHVNDATALMDEASPAVTLLDDQKFKSAPLSPSIFPLGLQDSADLLEVTLGGTAPAAHVASPRYLLSQTDTPAAKTLGDSMGKCLNCMMREGRAGRGPLRDMFASPQTEPQSAN